MTAISVVSAVLERLQYLQVDQDPNSLLQELSSEVEALKAALEKAKDVLADAEKNRKETQPVPDPEKRITWQFYKCEDAIEEYALEIGPKGKMGFRNFIKSTTKNAQRNLRSLKANIEGLSEKCKGPRGSRHPPRGENPSPVLLTKNQTVVIRRPPVRLQTKGLIDMEENIKRVLASEDRDRPVIPIWGAGGSGKTTLAKKVYEDAKAGGRFQGFAWFYIPRSFEMKSMLQAILIQLCPQCPGRKDEKMEMEDVELAELLFKEVQKKKCLIVLEDVWAIHVWQSIRIAFPLSDTDSKILLTTRMEDVAAESASGGTVYEMMILSKDESWELLKKKAEFDDDGWSEQMKKMGEEIAEHCQGSPLAVGVIGASLQKKSFDEWQRVLNALESIEDQDPEEKVKKVLAMGYSRLPHKLKPCFLYLGHFPEEYHEIQVEKLYLLWMSEGLVPLKDTRDKAKLDSTESFLHELACRSLLEMQEEEEPKFRSYKSCRLHDLIRDLCIWKGKEEEFFEIPEFENGNKPSPSTPRLAIHLNKYGGGSKHEKTSVRSLLVFDTRDSQPKSSWPQELSDLKDYKFLRVLHFDGVDFRVRELQKGIEKLAYLRYLSFQGCDLDKLPTFISNLSYLQTLDLRVRSRMIVPNVLSKMKRLRHLYFPVTYVRDGTDKLSLDGLIMLEILENFDTGMCNSEDLSKLGKLRILKVITEGNTDDLKAIIKCMDNNSSELQLSFLDVRKFDCYSKERLSVLESLLRCDTLHVLHIEGHIGKVPEGLKISEIFVQIVLNGSELNEDPMPILGALPNLRSLVLSNDAFVGKEMKCSASHFPQLRSLKLMNLHYLETWTVDERSLQKLSTLAIEKCGKLAMPHPGLKFVKNLKQLKVVPA
ncbi:hypothetical protein Pfo_026487 [Paulownia fortunei]|nr:hypothetical protein Pfo_026487 [Paulownia fortunei]